MRLPASMGYQVCVVQASSMSKPVSSGVQEFCSSSILKIGVTGGVKCLKATVYANYFDGQRDYLVYVI